jgi:hypothetical protein
MRKVVPLSELSRAIATVTGQPPPSYRDLYRLIVDGQLAAEKVRGRYQVDVLAAVESVRQFAA